MRIAFSPSKRRPGCPLLQIAYGGTVPDRLFQQFFPHEVWLVGATDDMGAYPVDEEHSLDVLSDIALAAAEAQGVNVTLISRLADVRPEVDDFGMVVPLTPPAEEDTLHFEDGTSLDRSALRDGP